MKEAVIPLGNITRETNRREGGEGDIRILAEDMKENGLINPVTVMLAEDAAGIRAYKVVAGRRRLAAAGLLGWAEIRANVLEPDEAGKAEAIAGSENINRLAMHPLDEAAVFKKLIENGEPIEGLAKRFDRSKAAIWQRVQLLDLDEGIKDIFRQGKISLQGAAMLRGLEAGQQEAFPEEAKTLYGYRDGDGIEDWEVARFISRTLPSKLYKCVEGEECKPCKKRTFLTDKTFFPGLEGAADSCADSACYRGKWNRLLAGLIKAVKKKHKTHAEADAVFCRSGMLPKLFGKKAAIGGTDYHFRPWDYALRDVPVKGGLPCFAAEFEGEELKISPCWMEKPEGKNPGGKKEKSPFAPMVKMLELPKEEAEKLAADLGKGIKGIWAMQEKAAGIESKAKKNVYKILLERKAKENLDEKKEREWFVKNFFEEIRFPSEYAPLFGIGPVAGKTDVDGLPCPKLFALLNLALARDFTLPGISGVERGDTNSTADWLGASNGELKEMYKKELLALMPKPKPKAGKN